MRVLDAGSAIPAGRSSGRTTMNWNRSKKLSAGRAVAVLGMAGVLLMSSGHIGLAQSEESASKNGLEGTWFVQVTLRDCASNAQIGPRFNSLVTFHRGGTLSESTSNRAFAIGQRSDGQGNWTFEGHHTYKQRMVNLINFDTAPNLPFSPGFFEGLSVVTHTLELTDADHGTSSGTNEFYKADGTLYRTGCSTAVARRFE
jgi:hypothetical protein